VYGYGDLVRRLLSHPMVVETINNRAMDGSTALLVACGGCDMHLVRMLMVSGGGVGWGGVGQK